MKYLGKGIINHSTLGLVEIKLTRIDLANKAFSGKVVIAGLGSVITVRNTEKNQLTLDDITELEIGAM